MLFVTDKYYPFPYAKAICVQNVAREMVDEGVETHILAFEDCGMELSLQKEGVVAHKVKTDTDFKLLCNVNNFSSSSTDRILSL